MRNAGLKETQAGIKIAGRNINNLRYADDINHSKILYDPSPRIIEVKPKTSKWDLIKLLHSKGNYKQGETTTLRMEEYTS